MRPIARVRRCSTSWRELHIEYYREKNSTKRKRDAETFRWIRSKPEGERPEGARGWRGETEGGSRNYPYISWPLQDSYRSGRRRFSRDSIQTEGNLQILSALSALKFCVCEFAIRRNVVAIYNLDLVEFNAFAAKFFAFT